MLCSVVTFGASQPLFQVGASHQRLTDLSCAKQLWPPNFDSVLYVVRAAMEVSGIEGNFRCRHPATPLL